jgi:hypothetical protein
MRQTVGSGWSRSYAAAMAGLWLDLRRTLSDLDVLAEDPARLDEDEALPALQYELHAAGETLAGIDPPDEAEAMHEELADALAEARDATAEVAEAYSCGGLELAHPLVWEWRGALFRVRYARLRLAGTPVPVVTTRARAAAPAARTPPAVTASVVAVGSALVLAAALLGLWLLVALTLAGTLAASLLLRP